MLTKTDLSQIRNVVHGAIQEGAPKIVREETGKIIGEKLEPVHKDIKLIKKDIKRMKEKIGFTTVY